MPFSVSIRDELTPWLRDKAVEQGMLRPALASLGWMVQKRIKEGIQSRSPGGKPYPEWMPLELRRRLHDQKSWGPLGELLKAIGYDKRFLDEGAVRVGWTSRSGGMWGKRVQNDLSVPVTPAMRRLFFAKGIPLGAGKTRITAPGRLTIHPMFEALRPRFASYVEGKVLEYLEKGVPSGVKVSRRKYAVREEF